MLVSYFNRVNTKNYLNMVCLLLQLVLKVTPIGYFSEYKPSLPLDKLSEEVHP
jgi:hypothetical protein